MDTPWVGEGSIKQIESGKRKGKWRLQWTVLVSGKERQTIDKLFDTKGDAVKWRDDKKVELRTGVRVDAVRKKGALTLQGVFDSFSGTKEKGYLDGKWVEMGVASSTVATRTYRWNKWVKEAPIASLPIRGLTRDQARAHVRRMKEEGAPVQTIKDVVDVLKVLVNSAIRELDECRNLPGNPFEKLALQNREEKALAAKAKAERGTKVALLSPAVAAKALTKPESVEQRARLAVHILAGLRTGEGMALTREQIDFARRVIVVDRAVRLDGASKQYVGLPKGEKIRLVAMCPTLAAILENHVASLPAGRSHLFGLDRRDGMPRAYRYYELWREAVEAAKLPKGVTPKICRMSFNNWVEKLMPDVSLSTRLEHMGHALDGEGPSGVQVNLVNYTGHIPEAYEILRGEIERVVKLKA